MTREFIILPEFDSMWKKLGLTEDDLRSLEEYLCLHPHAGDVIPDTSGLRKLRWQRTGRGKRGSIRTLYVDFVHEKHVYLITAYSKSEKDDFTSDEKRKIKRLVLELKSTVKRNRNEKEKSN